MNKKELKYADYFICELLKIYPNSVSPKQKLEWIEYKYAHSVVMELQDKLIIERKGIKYKISSIYVDELREYKGYSGYLESLRLKSTFVKVSSHWAISRIKFIVATVIFLAALTTLILNAMGIIEMFPKNKTKLNQPQFEYQKEQVQNESENQDSIIYNKTDSLKNEKQP